MKRILLALLAALLLLALSLGVCAEEAEVGKTETTAQTETPASDTGNLTGGAETVSNSTSENEEEPDILGTTASSAGERILAFFEEHIGDIFSCLTLLGSLLLLCGYKRGFLPLLCRGLERISQDAEKLGSRAGDAAKETQEQMTILTEKTEPLIERLTEICQGAETLRERTAALDRRLREMSDDRERLNEVMRGVADLLYGVFSAANLPAYAKEQLGQRYAALTALVSNGEQSHESADL